ncbi:MAG: hypothetical protein PW791_05055 [Neorhizobium sp.]|nr:hypothetical protein [Neorhizobium sp.]
MKILVLVAGLLAGITMGSAAQAGPMSSPMSSSSAAVETQGPNVVRVDYACGRGRHITRHGICRPNYRRPVRHPSRHWHRPPPRWHGHSRPQHHGYHRPPPRHGWSRY